MRCVFRLLDNLESVQKRAFKIITGGIVRTPTNYLYNEIGLETLKTRRDRNVLLFFFKIMHNMVPGYLQELKPEKQKQGRYMFRNKNDLAENNKVSEVLFALCHFTLEQIGGNNKNYYKL